MSVVEELAGLLQDERQRLEFLLFKLVAAGQLLRSGETRFLGWSAEEIEDAATQVREADLLRATVVSRAASELALLEREPSLQTLASQTTEPYRSILDDHRLALRRLLGEIEQVQYVNNELAADRLRLVNDVVAMIDASTRDEDR
jgi:hypothetical protein